MNCVNKLYEQKRRPTKTKKQYYYEYRARHFNFFHVYCARSIYSVLKIAVVASNCFDNFKIAEKYDADWKPDVNRHQKGCEGTAIDLEIAEKLGRMKHHFVSTKDVGKKHLII